MYLKCVEAKEIWHHLLRSTRCTLSSHEQQPDEDWLNQAVNPLCCCSTLCPALMQLCLQFDHLFTRRGRNNSSTTMRNIMLFCVNFFLESIFSTSANVNFNQQYHQKVVPAIITAIGCTNTVQYTQRSSSMYHPLAWELNTAWSFQRTCHVAK